MNTNENSDDEEFDIYEPVRQQEYGPSSSGSALSFQTMSRARLGAGTYGGGGGTADDD